VAADCGESVRSVLGAADRLTALRRDEQHQMQEYVSLSSGIWSFSSKHSMAIRAWYMCPFYRRCRRPRPGAGSRGSSVSAPHQPTNRAAQAVARGGMPQYRLTGRIPAELQAQPGKALCIWGDAGWAVWFDKASTTTDVLRMNWSKLHGPGARMEPASRARVVTVSRRFDIPV